MKLNPVVVAAIGIGALLLLSKSAGAYSLSNLASFGPERVQPLQALADELQSRGYSPLQIKLMLAQAMHETGILTDNNYNQNAVLNKHNYAGISPGGVIATYPTISAFVDAWDVILRRGANPPLGATSVNDYAARLKTNGYYTDSLSNYTNALNYWFNLL